MIGYGVCEVLNKSFYAIRDGKTPMVTSVIGIMVNLAAAFVLTKWLHMGIGGLALAAALSSLSIALCLMVMMNKRRPGVIDTTFLLNLVKILLCGGASFAAAKMIYPLTAFLAGGMVLTLLRLCIAAAY